MEIPIYFNQIVLESYLSLLIKNEFCNWNKSIWMAIQVGVKPTFLCWNILHLGSMQVKDFGYNI